MNVPVPQIMEEIVGWRGEHPANKFARDRLRSPRLHCQDVVGVNLEGSNVSFSGAWLRTGGVNVWCSTLRDLTSSFPM